MQTIELYIKDVDGVYQRADLFEDESISITDTIQNVRDISKIFAPFSQQFNLPASKSNNKLFKHYYNNQIQNGFDARFKIDATIKLNGIDYKTGKLRLNSVSMKMNRAYSYKVVFFGGVVTLSDLLGDDELHDLDGSYLDPFDFGYTGAFARVGFTNGYNLSGSSLVQNNSSTDAGDLIFPFISATDYHYYDSNDNDFSFATPDDVKFRNVYYNGSLPTSQNVGDDGTWNSTTNLVGVGADNLKPAIRCYHIIKAIEQKYGLTFSTDFFNTTNEEFYDLYLWLHREKGRITSQIDTQSTSYNISDFTTSGTPTWTDGDSFRVTSDVKYEMYVIITNAPANSTYTINVNSADSWDREVSGTGNDSFFFRHYSNGVKTPNITISSQGNLSTWSIDIRILELEENFEGDFDIIVADYNFNPINNQSFSGGGVVTLRSQMPKIKTIDFLTNIFKMFNLTAYLEGTNIVVKTLDEYYADGTTYDITKYIDINQQDVERSKIYKLINFKFSEPKTFAIDKSNEISNNEFGNAKFRSTDENFDGGDYTIESKFEKVVYERMSNQVNNNQTNAFWGWFVDKDKNPTLNAPLVFYAEKESQTMLFENSTTSFSNISTYIRPSNVKTLSSGSQTINFQTEIDEFTGISNANSLFLSFYLNYINNVFDPNTRIIKFDAYLPTWFVVKYELNDTLIIAGKRFRINSIKTNLLTNKSELELITI
jgi:hypothetical protein